MPTQGRVYADGGPIGRGRSVAVADADEALAHAQQVVDRHPVMLSSGLCGRCGTAGPCERRWLALRVLARHDRLPRRRPGLSRPELLNARPVVAGVPRSVGAGFGWLTMFASGGEVGSAAGA